MNISLIMGAIASTVSAEPNATRTGSARSTAQTTQTATDGAFDPPPVEGDSREQIRHLLFGSPQAVKQTILLLHKLNYAEPNDWSRPVATGRGREVMAILTKRVGID